MKRVLKSLRTKSAARRKPTAERSGAPAWLNSLKTRLGLDNPIWLLLTWDVCGLSASLVNRHNPGHIIAEARSSQARFAAAVEEVLHELGRKTPIKLRQVALASRHLLPAVLSELPVLPDKPRRPEQMRELIQADMEPVLAEFGSLWSMGALLQARGFLSVEDRERVTMEEAVRRQNRASQLRYGEIALELDMIDRPALDECLDQQAALQNLDASLAAGWRGRMEDKQPLWLVCGVGQATHAEWREALAERGLKLIAALPLAWLPSQPEPPAGSEPSSARREAMSVDIECHAEEIVAIHRRNGLVVATRSEGRVERPLAADWLLRLISDWTAEARVDITLHLMHVVDDVRGQDLAEELGLVAGHPCALRTARETRAQLLHNLLREASVEKSALPRLAPAELRGSPLKNPDIRRMLALGGVVVAILSAEGIQRYRLADLEERMEAQQQTEKQKANMAQLEVRANLHLADLAKGLENVRRELEPMLADRSRLGRIVAMRRDLPDLLYLLAQAVGNDAVIEEIHNDNSRSQASAIQVIAWSPSYTGAQDFVNRMATLSRGKGYGVSQMEIQERKGRDNRKGHEVKFWLMLEESELEGDDTLSTHLQSATRNGNTGVSSQTPASGSTR